MTAFQGVTRREELPSMVWLNARSELRPPFPDVADLEGLEPPTPWFEAKCSIQLSYRSE